MTWAFSPNPLIKAAGEQGLQLRLRHLQGNERQRADCSDFGHTHRRELLLQVQTGGSDLSSGQRSVFAGHQRGNDGNPLCRGQQGPRFGGTLNIPIYGSWESVALLTGKPIITKIAAKAVIRIETRLKP